VVTVSFLPALGFREICKPPFLLTSPPKGGYGIFSAQSLQISYISPQAKNRQKSPPSRESLANSKAAEFIPRVNSKAPRFNAGMLIRRA